MSTVFRLHQLELRTRSASSTYEFQAGLNVVTGSYGTGKSSMFELIKYGLGASSAEIMPAIEDNLIRTILRVTVGRTRLVLDREFGQNRIQVTYVNDGNRAEEWSVTRIKTAPLVSDKLLELLGIPAARLARRGAGGSSVSVSFFDIFRFMYLPQADVPRSIAGHADPFLNPKRKAVLELAYGLSDQLVLQHEIGVVELKREFDTAKTETSAVFSFLESSGAPPQDALGEMSELARQEIVIAQGLLTQARRDASNGVTIDDQQLIRGRLSELRVEAAANETEVRVAKSAVARGIRLIAQLELDEDREQQLEAASGIFEPLNFEACPRCLQDLPVREGRDLCVLCGQHEHVAVEGPTDRLGRVQSQKAEAESVLDEDRDRLESAMTALAISRRELADVVADFESQLSPALLLPALDHVSFAAAEVERVRATLRDMERFQDQWDIYQSGVDQLESLQEKILEAESAVAEARASLKRNGYRVTSLSDRFDEEIRGLGFSDYRSAGVDERTYLPLINDEPFERLSVSGARKVLANDAYYLALLGNSLSDSSILLPGFLMLDGPRTSLGNTPEDIAAGDRLYYRFSLLAEAYPEAQIIVADNGLPSASAFGRNRPNVIELSYESPLLQDVAHPGPGNVPTVGQPLS